jgi:uncharacterized protein (TIGR02301 family)
MKKRSAWPLTALILLLAGSPAASQSPAMTRGPIPQLTPPAAQAPSTQRAPTDRPRPKRKPNVIRRAPSAEPAAPVAPPASLEAPPPPYEPQLMRLSEIMGSLAYLRDLCGARDGDSWNARMTALIEAEATTEQRRERLAGAYNKGYRGFATTYRTCTANAELVITRYLEEGGRLARDIASRYSGG